MRIIVTEFPKSGGSWLTSMLADTLGVPARDIYHDNNFKQFDLTNHPWYRGSEDWDLTEHCVIKSHEQAGTQLHNFPAFTVHLVRDGRDVFVSSYFFAKDFCVKNGIISEFNQTFDAYLRENIEKWVNYITGWRATGVYQVRYEDLLADTQGVLRGIIDQFGLKATDEQIEHGILANTKDKFREKLSLAFKHNTFVRKGISGDWVNHFTQEQKELFNRLAGTVLVDLGYEHDTSWCRRLSLLGRVAARILKK